MLQTNGIPLYIDYTFYTICFLIGPSYRTSVVRPLRTQTVMLLFNRLDFTTAKCSQASTSALSKSTTVCRLTVYLTCDSATHVPWVVFWA